MFILDINDKGSDNLPRGFKYSVDNTDLIQQAWQQVFVQEVWECQAEDGKDNTTRPTTNLKNREINVTASSGKAEREVNEITEIKRREPIALIWIILTVKN